MSHSSYLCGPNMMLLVLVVLKTKFSLNFSLFHFFPILTCLLREEEGRNMRVTRCECRPRHLFTFYINEIAILQNYGSWDSCVETVKKSFLNSGVWTYHWQLEILNYQNTIVIQRT